MGGKADSGGAMAGMNPSGMNMPMPARDSAQSMANMPGMAHGAMSGGGKDSSMASMPHGAMADGMNMNAMSMSGDGMAMHMRMLSDPVIRARIAADTALRRMMTEMIAQMPADHRPMMQQMLNATPSKQGVGSRAAKPKTGTTKKASAAKPPAAKKPAPKKEPPMDMKMPGMDHSKMPGMSKP
jgi:hypothetical protein